MFVVETRPYHYVLNVKSLRKISSFAHKHVTECGIVDLCCQECSMIMPNNKVVFIVENPEVIYSSHGPHFMFVMDTPKWFYYFYQAYIT